MSVRSDFGMSFLRHVGVFLLYGWLQVAMSVAATEIFNATAEHTIPTYIPSGTTKASGTTTATSSSTPTPSLAFEDLDNTTVCGEQDITWLYTGSYEYSLILAVTGGDENDSIAMILSTYEGGLSPNMSFEWKTVDVPEGAYTIQITLEQVDLTFASETFYILSSDDESCLGNSTTGSGTSSTAETSTSAAGSSSGGSTSLPAVGAVSSSTMSKGGIAGVVVGSFALVVGLLVALWLFRRCRRRSNGGAPRGGLFEKRRPRGAVSISSRTDSISSDHAHTPGAVGQSGGGAPVYTLNDSGPRSSGEKRQHVLASGFGILKPKATHRSPYEHRSSFGSFGSTSTGVTSPSQGQHRPSPSRHSSLMVGADPFSSAPPSRRQSQDQVPVALYSSTSQFTTPPIPRSFSFPQNVSASSSVLPDSGGIDAEPLSPPAHAVIAQTISGREPTSPLSPTSSQSSHRPGLAAPRRKSGPSRKPVPTYSPSISNEEMELTEPASPRSHSGGVGGGGDRSSTGQNSFASSSAAGFSSAGSAHDWSSAAAHSHSAASGNGTGMGYGISPASSRSFLPHPARASSSISEYGTYGNLPELNHKSSFGERQMHVLIPDPPSKEMQ